jgi:hypothetical protein
MQNLKEEEMPGDDPANGKGPDGDCKLSCWGGVIREISVTALSAAIAITTLYMLVLCFWHGGGNLDSDGLDAFARQKDILGLALGLFGTVTGYYFGRIPAEKAADAAKTAEQNTKKMAASSLDSLQRQVSQLSAAADPGAHVLSLLSDIAIAKANLR